MAQAKSPSGRETSFGLPTSGHKGWMPVMFKDGTSGQRPDQEGYKNVVTNEEFIPPGGWKDGPPGPTGETVRHASDAYCKGWDRIWGKKEADHASSQ
jgi:hypothetical protein